MSRSLTGRRIVLTRSAEDCAEWADRLDALGATPVAFPCITRELLDTRERRKALAAAAARADWLVMTSRRGVEAVAAMLGGAAPQGLAVAVVGEATAEAARRRLGRVDLVGGGTAAALAERLRAALTAPAVPAAPGGGGAPHVLLALAANAGTTLSDALDDVAQVERIDVYRTIPTPPRAPKEPLSRLAADAILFASPSAVAGFVNRVELDAAAPVYTIGATTSAAARRHGLAVSGQARQPNLEGLVEAMQ